MSVRGQQDVDGTQCSLIDVPTSEVRCKDYALGSPKFQGWREKLKLERKWNGITSGI